MYDYLFKFDTEAEAIEALPDWHNTESGWDGSSVIPISIIAQKEIWVGEKLVQPRIDVPGYWMVIAVPDRDDDLYALAVQETLRPDTPTPFRDCITRTKLDDEDYAAFQDVDPVFAGAAYVFGGAL